jgi:hypothetical protein
VESGDRWLERSGSCMWKVGTSKVVAPTCVGLGPMGWPLRVSIECTDCILVYGPSKHSNLSSTESWLKPTTSLAVRGRETGWGPTNWSAGVLGM